MDIGALEIHPNFKRELLKVLSGNKIAEGSFDALAAAGCDPHRLAYLVTEPREPKRRLGSAEDRKAERRELRAMAGTLMRLARQTKAVLARRRYDRNHLFGPDVYVSVSGFERTVGHQAIDGWFERWSEAVRALAEQPFPRMLLNCRDWQRVGLMQYVRDSTCKPHYAQVADLLGAAEARAKGDVQVTEDYLKKIDLAFKQNQRKWREAARRDRPGAPAT